MSALSRRLELLEFLHAGGACARAGQESFYPGDGQHATMAKRVCAGCPVTGECLGYATEFGEAYGVWGGQTAEERRRVRRDKTRKAS